MCSQLQLQVLWWQQAAVLLLLRLGVFRCREAGAASCVFVAWTVEAGV